MINDRIMNMYRLITTEWTDGKRFTKILDLLDEYEEKPVGIALFSSATHSPLPIRDIKRISAEMKPRIAEAKERGYTCGINPLATIGHHLEYPENTLSADIGRMTNIHGEICMGSCCMNDEGLRKYVAECYQLWVEAEPDFIWIDDDVRLGHMPIGNGCFCDNCIDIFNKENGYSFNRESLNKMFNTDSDEALAVRKKWLEHNAATLKNLFCHIRKTVDSVSRNMPLGTMSGEIFYEGAAYSDWMNAVSDNGKNEVFMRPGGGMYTDHIPLDFIQKADGIGMQSALVPKYVKNLYSELENFPYQLMKKGPRATVFESNCHIASGATGTAYNIFCSDINLDVMKGHLEKIREVSAFQRYVTGRQGRVDCLGIHRGWNRYCQAPLESENWLETCNRWNYGAIGEEIFSSGMPVSYNFDSAQAFILSQRESDALSDDEIMNILTKGVYMDAKAAKALIARGYGKYIGFDIGETVNEGFEVYLPHEINEDFEGGFRNCRQAFFEGDSIGLIPHSGAVSLSKIRNYSDEVVSECGMGIFENELGGRVCVAGYYPFTYVQDTQKVRQIKRIFNWITRNGLEAYVNSYGRIYTRARKLEDKTVTVTLLNCSFDDYRDVELYINCDSNTCTVLNEKSKKMILKCENEDNGYKVFRIPIFNAWSALFVETI